jgi:C_GCAxxG_C_C family probable redox protein
MDANRRRFMRSGAMTLAALGSGFGATGCARQERSQKPEDQPGVQRGMGPPVPPLAEGDRLYLNAEPEQVIEQAGRLARQFHKGHGGCARCTVAALQKSFAFGPQDQGLFRAASCLDGGATPHGVQSCGAFTGAGMYIGWLCGTEAFGSTRLSHQLIRDVYQRFEDRYGSVLCEDVRREANGDCTEVVARAACWTAEVLSTQFVDHRAAAPGNNLV